MKVLQNLIHKASEKELEQAEYLLNETISEPDYIEIYRQIFECGQTAYGAARIIAASGTSQRNQRTLHHHALQIEASLIEFFGGITLDSLLNELQEEGVVHCPDELIKSFDRYLKERDIDTEKWTSFTLLEPLPER